MRPPKQLTELMRPLTQRNIELSTETREEKIERIKQTYGLSHGQGIRKKKQNNNRKNKKR